MAFDFPERGLAAENVTLPDVLFVREERRSILGDRCIEAAPDLIAEILSPTTRAFDLPRGRKWEIYERYGVLYFWIIDLEAQTVSQYTWSDGHYGEPVILRPGDVLSSPLFPGIARPVERLFAGIR